MAQSWGKPRRRKTASRRGPAGQGQPSRPVVTHRTTNITVWGGRKSSSRRGGIGFWGAVAQIATAKRPASPARACGRGGGGHDRDLLLGGGRDMWEAPGRPDPWADQDQPAPGTDPDDGYDPWTDNEPPAADDEPGEEVDWDDDLEDVL
jgi:hypothetical protein